MALPHSMTVAARLQQIPEHDRILQTLVLGQGFQLLLAVCDAPNIAAEFRDSLAYSVAEQLGAPWSYEVINPYVMPGRDPFGTLTQQDLVDEILTRLVYPSASYTPNFCLVIDGSFYHSSGVEAWTWLFRRMNERRNVIVGNLNHSLLLCLSPSLFKIFAKEAPDFWSIQSAFVVLPELKTLAQIYRCPDATSLLHVLWSIWPQEKLTMPKSPRSTDEVNKEPLPEIAGHWLFGHEDSGAWSHVWRKLIDLDPDKGPLLHFGRLWLIGREDRENWSNVWGKLIDLDPDKGPLLHLGRFWLIGREDREDWSHVWGKLIDLDPDKGPLLHLGLPWLIGREDREDWSHVWGKLIDLDPDKGPLLHLGRFWLIGREDREDWSHVWRKLIDLDSEKAYLVDLGLQWINGRERRKDWPFVFEILLDYYHQYEMILPLGQNWLKLWQSHPGWPYVFLKLLPCIPKDDELLHLGHEWLVTHPNHQKSDDVRTLLDSASHL